MKFNIENMLHPEVYDHPVSDIRLIETHISWVVLTGEYAYKIKKPVNFGFLDFSTLEKRLDCCQQEVRLNSRLAAQIYLDVVSINGSPDKPCITGPGDIIEYAVKMAQFPQSAQLDNMLADGRLSARHMDAIARMIADFHHSNLVADDTSDYGNSEQVNQPVEENFIQIEQHIDTMPYARQLETLRQWSQVEYSSHQETLAHRKLDGFIRECHGDMHLCNMLWLDGQPLAFDCIEFNASLRWIDVISEVAFLVMDLKDRKQVQLANRFLNSYLEITGDYSALSVLPYYLAYRAMVRAKVNALRLEQENTTPGEREQALQAFESYLELAMSFTHQETPKLLIMRGLSASGKSTISQQLLDGLGAIRIRSDIERKRLYNVEPASDIKNEVNSGIYTAQASQQTYSRLLELASLVIGAGFNVIIDAAFLKHEQRSAFQKLANDLGVPYIILALTAPDEVLRDRIRRRKNDVSDADLEVLEYQITHRQSLRDDEASIEIDSTTEIDIAALIDTIKNYQSN